MRVNISEINNLNRNELRKLDSLKKGDVIKARVIEVKNGIAKIDLGNGEIIEGKLDISSNLLKGKLVNFLIKDTQDNVLTMSPVYDDIDFSSEFVLKNKSLIMDRILNLSNLSNDEKNVAIIENMISYKMPLKPEDIEAISKYTDKLISLLDLSDGDEIQTPPTSRPLDENINKLIKVIDTENESQIRDTEVKQAVTSQSQAQEGETLEQTENIARNNEFKAISKEFLSGEKITQNQNEDINIPRNVEVKNSENITELKDLLQEFDDEDLGVLKFKDITEQIKNELKNIFSTSTKPEQIIQKLTFLMKSDIDVTINNLSRLTNLLENHQTLNKEITEVLEMALDEGVIDETTKNEFLDKTKNIELKFDGKDNEKLAEFYKDIKEVSERLLTEISSSNKSSDQLNLKTEQLKDSIDFYNKINDKTTMMLIPFTLNNKEIENSLYVLSKRKVAKRSDNIKVYMALNTNNLEKIKILCDFSYDRLNVNFKVKENYISLFESGKMELQKILEEKGYDNTFIYINREEEENVLDLISYDDTIDYMLNIKV